MKQFSIFNFQFSIEDGFTIIELVVVFSVMAIISTIGIASFQSYSNTQSLRTAALNLKTLLNQARSQASTQVEQNAGSCGSFQGYEVRICCSINGSNCPTCLSSGDYELDEICSSTPNGILISNSKFTSGVSINATNTTQRTFHFIPITGGVTKGGNIVLDGANNATQTITVSSTGVIQ